ncbi:MAG: hypothetical protein KDA42_02725 [Planctomycetales bacterium]|nr:hypothetical protein [Planctomycetales bacterium]
MLSISMRPRFSLRLLLLLITVLAAVVGHRARRAHLQREVRWRVQSLGGQMHFAHELDYWGSGFWYCPAKTPRPPLPAWLTQCTGDDFWYQPVWINLDGTSAADADLVQIARLPHLYRLRLMGTGVTLDGIATFQQTHPETKIAWHWTELQLRKLEVIRARQRETALVLTRND